MPCQYHKKGIPKLRRLTQFARSLLIPIGQLKSQQVAPLNGKKKRKQSRTQSTARNETNQVVSKVMTLSPVLSDTNAHLTIGFNTTMRYLETLARLSAPDSLSPQLSGSILSKPRPLAAVFVANYHQLSILYSHLPLLIKTASLASPSSSAIRLIKLPQKSEERLGAALAIPRIGLIGVLENAPNAETLIEMVRQRVPEIEIPWLAKAASGFYFSTNIDSIQTTVPTKMKSGGQKRVAIDDKD